MSAKFFIEALGVILTMLALYIGLAYMGVYFRVRRDADSRILTLMRGLLIRTPLVGTCYGLIGGLLAYLATWLVDPEKGIRAREIVFVVFVLMGLFMGAIGGLVAFLKAYKIHNPPPKKPEL